jgi:hypothetical protein
MKVRFFGISMDLTWIIQILIKALKALVDGFIPGDELSIDQIKGTRTLDYLAKEWGKPYVESTETDIDDQAIHEILALTKDTSEEGGFELATVPEL